MCQYPPVPRWKDDEDRGAFGAWLSAQVGEQTFDWLAGEMAKRGYRHGADYYRAMASGNKPAGRVIGRALREFFGGGPETGLDATERPDSVLEAVRVLLAEIQAERAERREWERGFLEAMRELARAAAPQDDHAPALPGDARR